MKNIGIFLAGMMVGVLAMDITVYYLRDHYAMSLLPWIMVGAALILILLIIIAYLLQRHRANKLERAAIRQGYAVPQGSAKGFAGKKSKAADAVSSPSAEKDAADSSETPGI